MRRQLFRFVTLLVMAIVLANSQRVMISVALDQSDLNDIITNHAFFSSEESGTCSTVTGGSTANVPGGAVTDYPIRVPLITDAAQVAAAIDQFIQSKNPNSPFIGMGRYFVQGGMRAGINPFLGVSQALQETTLGNGGSGISDGSHNAFGRTATNSQPHVGSSRLWYKWDSWEASLYAETFPASGDSSAPDDIFQYIARRYANNLDYGLLSFLAGDPANDRPAYAPASDGNDPPGYAAHILEWTNQIVASAGSSIDLTHLGAADSGGTQTTPLVQSGAAGCGLNTGSAVSTALVYAWPDYRGSGNQYALTMKPEYEAAVASARSSGLYVGGIRYPGVDCGGFVTRVMLDSGYEPEYNSSGHGGSTYYQLAWVRNNWQRIGRGSEISTTDLRPGDVAFRVTSDGGNDGHTFMYVGQQPGFDSVIASSSLDERAPMAGHENPLAGNIEWYRKN